MHVRAALIQMRHGDSVAENLQVARERVAQVRESGATLVLLPEYFFAAGPPSEAAASAIDVRAMLTEASRGLALGANVVEQRDGALWNFGVVYEDGALVLEQAKVHPMPREAEAGVKGGARFRVGTAAGLPTGMLVCADILYPEASRVLSLQGAEVLLNPVMSPLRDDDPTKGARDSIFVARAYDSGAFVLKAGGFRATGPHRVAGRSLIAAPWGILARAKDDLADETLAATLDLDELRQFRASKESFPPRRPDAYKDLVR